MQKPSIHVCHAGTCRAYGAEALIPEIEELARMVGGCAVSEIGCLGYCSQAPNVLVKKWIGGDDPCDPLPYRIQRVHVEVTSPEASIKVVEDATGKRPKLDSPEVQAQFMELRTARARRHARSVYKWNAALKGFAEQAAKQPSLRAELQELLAFAGQSGGGDGVPDAAMPSSIEMYTQWSLVGVSVVSKHSALYSFSSKDRKRGTPHPRGSGVRPEPITWHTTLLAEVGPNSEGPLPWVERDYTPVSSAKDWEQGRCDILIKTYPDGAATSWLHRATPAQVWLSRPVKTMSVPGLVADGVASLLPGSVLLLLAGTGAVALPQILHHRDPIHKLGIPTVTRDQLRVPIDVLVSYREDDVLLLPQIAELCRGGEQAGVRHCTLLLTPEKNSGAPPFPSAPAGDAGEAERALQGLANAKVVRSRLKSAIVAEALKRMPAPCRVVVSGPSGFNSAAREMLTRSGVDTEQITVLTA